MRLLFSRIAQASCCLALALATTCRADPIASQLRALADAGPQGAGSEQARWAHDALGLQSPEFLPRLLESIDERNPVGANWVRAVFETIVARHLSGGPAAFPLAKLRAIVDDPGHSSRARRLALDLCEKLQPGVREAALRGFLDDAEFRDEAVELVLTAGEQALERGDRPTAQVEFRRAFDHALDGDQVVRAAGGLGRLGQHVDIPRHLGLVVDWWLIGPFDAPGTSGFDRVLPPEQDVDLAASFVGQEGRQLAWTRHRTADPLGLVNLAQGLAPAKEAVGYAYARLVSPREQPAQLRVGADDNCTVWLNGQRVFGRRQWLNGIRLDRFVEPVTLRTGVNELLVKVCQGPQHKDPQVPNNWSLQLRFTDLQGRGLPLDVADNPAEAAP